MVGERRRTLEVGAELSGPSTGLHVQCSTLGSSCSPSTTVTKTFNAGWEKEGDVPASVSHLPMKGESCVCKNDNDDEPWEGKGKLSLVGTWMWGKWCRRVIRTKSKGLGPRVRTQVSTPLSAPARPQLQDSGFSTACIQAKPWGQKCDFCYIWQPALRAALSGPN